MQSIAASYTASISELKKNPSALLDQAEGPIAILNHNKTKGYLLSAALFESLLDKIDDQELGEIVKKRQKEKNKAIKVSLKDL